MKKLIILGLFVASCKAAIIDPYRFVTGGESNNLLTGLVAFWRFEESSGNALDSSGNARHLTLMNTVPQVSGRVGNAREHSGTESADGFNITDAAWNSLNGSDFTISFWFRPTDLTVTSYVMHLCGKANIDADDFGWSFELNAARTAIEFRFSSTMTGGIRELLSTPYPFETNKFYFVYVSRSGTDFTMGLAEQDAGGIFFGDANDTTAEPEAATLGDIGQPFSVGLQFQADLTTPDSNTDAAMVMDELGWWDRALDMCELNKLYNAGAGRLYTTFGNGPCL